MDTNNIREKNLPHHPDEPRWLLARPGTFEDLKASLAGFMRCNAHGRASATGGGARCTCCETAEGSPRGTTGVYREGNLHACLTRTGDLCGSWPAWEEGMVQVRFMQQRSIQAGGRVLHPLASRKKSVQVEELLEDAARLAGAGVYLDSRNFGVRWHIRFKLAIMDGGGHIVSSLVSSNRFHGMCVSVCRHTCTAEGLERCFQCMPRALVPAAIMARASGGGWQNWPQRSAWRYGASTASRLLPLSADNRGGARWVEAHEAEIQAERNMMTAIALAARRMGLHQDAADLVLRKYYQEHVLPARRCLPVRGWPDIRFMEDAIEPCSVSQALEQFVGRVLDTGAVGRTTDSA